MSQGATIWRIIVEETAEYEETVDVKAYFDKIISLWKEYPKAISSRVTASIPVDEGSHLWNEVISCFEQKHRFSPRDCSEISVNKFICRYTDPTKARKFSENAFEVSFYQALQHMPVNRNQVRMLISQNSILHVVLHCIVPSNLFPAVEKRVITSLLCSHSSCPLLLSS